MNDYWTAKNSSKMSSHVPESIRRKEKRDAILRAQEVAAALTSENVCFWEYEMVW